MKANSKGQSLVETSLILAAFMTLVFGMIFIGQTLFIRQTFAGRVHDAARWGALNAYDPDSIRNLVLYGKAAPDRGNEPFMGLAAADVVVANPGCPGPRCRVIVGIPGQGIRSSEPMEYKGEAMGAAPSKP